MGGGPLSEPGRSGAGGPRLVLGKLTAKLRSLAGRDGGPLRVFVSYRREAGPGQAHHLATDLERQLGGEHVFLDERAIGAGEDFDAVINERVDGADVLVAVIGPGWVDMQPRLLDERDYVRREIEAALVRRVPVIAVATPGATLPSAEGLPDSMRPMLARPSLSIDIPSDALWEVAVDSLARWLLAIRDEKRRRDRERDRAVGDRADAERDLERGRDRAAAAATAAAAAAERQAGLEGELPVAQEELARRRAETEPARAGPGLRVFICHHPDGAADAARLAADIGARIGPERVGRSGGSEGGGPQAGEGDRDGTTAARADALLAVIGPGWLAGGVDDRVEREIAAALARGVPIIPLLTRHAALPNRDALPDSLRPLLGHQALMLPEQFWDAAVGRLLERLAEIERAIARREEAVTAAAERCAGIERDLERARRQAGETRDAVATASERVAALEAGLAATQERERELVAQPPDANPAYLAGPPAPRALPAR